MRRSRFQPCGTAAALVLLGAACSAQMGLSVLQPFGAGSLRLEVSGCAPGAEIFNFITFAIATPTGSGPFFGLSITNSQVLFTELTSPPGTVPFHVNAGVAGDYVWAFANPPLPSPLLLSADFVTVAWNTAGYGGRSNVVRLDATF